MKRILIVAAHPDDEILGCGATVLKHIENGDEVYSLVLGEGITSRFETRTDDIDKQLDKLHTAHNKVAEFMGFKNHWLYDFPDNRFDSVPLLDIVKVVEQIKNEVHPDVIYTHFENDLNIDHRITFQAVLTASRPLSAETVKEIYSFEIPSSTEWVSPYNGSGAFRPNVFVNVKKTIFKKIDAMKLYNTELKIYPHPRSPKALEIIAQKWGVNSGLEYAEAFILIRKVVSM